jgi:hypothetical protein
VCCTSSISFCALANLPAWDPCSTWSEHMQL